MEVRSTDPGLLPRQKGVSGFGLLQVLDREVEDFKVTEVGFLAAR